MAYSNGGGGKMSAVDAILAEAADMIALEQIAKLNTAHLTDDSSTLPSTLESRFRKLKSLPSAPTTTTPLTVRSLGRSVTAPHPTTTTTTLPNPPPPPHAAPTAPAAKQYLKSGGGVVHEEEKPEDEAENKDSSSPSSAASSPLQNQPRPPPATVPSPHAAADDEDLERLFGGSGGARGRSTLRERNRGRRDDESPSPPPPRQACCFGFSPRKPSLPKEGKEKKVHGSGDVLGVDAGEWGDENKRMVAELKEQQRKLKKALEEQVKVSRETAKMATWVKQASARMTHTEAIDDLLSDCEDDDELK